ncbi:MAG TPA: response regulator [Xanthobacteraceae bacterium]|jgi:FixJ family two-component response regulator
MQDLGLEYDRLRFAVRKFKLKARILSQPKIVLVLDDDPGMLKGLERLLKARGYKVQLFNSVNDFRSRADPHHAGCLVLDVNLNGTSGIDLRRQLTSSSISLPVIFITGNDSDIIRNAALEVGCVAYLTKPFSAKSLIEAVESATTEANGAE